MTKTFKIFSIISFIAMAIVLTFVGVWAITDLDFAVGGDITYTAPEPEPVTPEEVPYLTFEYYDDLTAKLMSCSSSAPTKVEIPAQIEKDGKTYTVTSIKEGYFDEMDGEGEGMFYGTNVKDLVIPDTVIDIGEYAFNCDSFNSVSIGKTAERDFFYNGIFVYASIDKLIIRKGVTRIGRLLFFCAGIDSWELPNTLKEVSDEAFNSSTMRGSIIIPDHIEVIGNAAFNTSQIESVTIGSGVKEIGGNAFYLCYSLTEVYIKATTPPVLEIGQGGQDMFGSSSNIPTIYVPRASESVYKTADGWVEYADYIVGYDF